MVGITNLEELLKSMSPQISSVDYVFCTVEGELADYMDINPLASFMEPEGLTLILSVPEADKAQFLYDNTFKQITLTVHSSLAAIGLTAAVASKLSSYEISANVVAAYYHDHIFVPSDKADQALKALKEFQL